MDKMIRIIEEELMTIYHNIGKVLDEDCIYDYKNQRSQNLFQHLWETQSQISLLETRLRIYRGKYEKCRNWYYTWFKREEEK